MDELISRKEAVKAIANRLGFPAEHWEGVAEDWLKDVPTVDAVPTDDIPRAIATIIENEMDMRVIQQNYAIKNEAAYDDGYKTGYLQAEYDYGHRTPPDCPAERREG